MLDATQNHEYCRDISVYIITIALQSFNVKSLVLTCQLQNELVAGECLRHLSYDSRVLGIQGAEIVFRYETPFYLLTLFQSTNFEQFTSL